MSNIQPYQPQNTGMSLRPRNLQEAMEFAELIAQSDMVPKDYRGRPANVLLAVQWGEEIGLPPLQSLQNIAVINGRPSIYGDAMLALVKNSGLMEQFVESRDGDTATCELKRVGEPSVTRSFSIPNAKTAGLWGKQGPWTQYPDRMLQMRARSWALRDVFPDVLRGLYIAEEAQDIPEDKPEYKPQRRVEKQSEKPIRVEISEPPLREADKAKKTPLKIELEEESKPNKTGTDPKKPYAITMVNDEQTEIIRELSEMLKMDSGMVSADIVEFYGVKWKKLTSDNADHYIDVLNLRIAKQDSDRTQSIDVKALQKAGVKS